jgi:hypothetical protein
MSVEAGERSGPAEDGAEATAAGDRFGAALEAVGGLFSSLRRVVTTLSALLVAEARLLRASVALVFLASIALVAFSVSLWACVVALIGWAVAVAAHSLGIALASLVVLHLILVGAIWLVIKRAIHHASFPLTRAEFSALRHALRRDVARFQHASSPADREASP